MVFEFFFRNILRLDFEQSLFPRSKNKGDKSTTNQSKYNPYLLPLH